MQQTAIRSGTAALILLNDAAWRIESSVLVKPRGGNGVPGERQLRAGSGLAHPRC